MHVTDYDKRAFDEVYSRYASELWKFAARRTGSPNTADDFVQEVFTSFWIRRNTLKSGTNVRAYLYRMLHNLIIDHGRHSNVVSRESGLNSVAVSGLGESLKDPSQVAEQDELDRALDAVLLKFSEQQRALVHLRWSQGLSFSEIAEVLGITPAAAQKQAGRVLEKIRAELKGFK